MKSAVIRFVLLLIVAFAAIATWVFVLDKDDEPESIPLPARLYAVPQNDVVSVAVRTGTSSVAFERRDGVWYFADAPLVPVNLDRWGGVVLLLSGPEVERVLPPLSDTDQFGLDSPGVVSIGLTDGKRVVVRLGAETPDGRNVYVQVEGESELALVNAPWVRVLLRLADEPPLPYWYYRVGPDRVRLFEIESANGIVTFLLGLPGADGGPPDRVMLGDAVSDLTDAELDAVLHVAGGPPGFAVSAWPEGLTPEKAGLQSPRAVLRVTYELAVPLEDKSAVSAVYAVGGLTADGDGYYATTPDSPLLLTFDAAWVEGVLSLAGRRFAGEG